MRTTLAVTVVLAAGAAHADHFDDVIEHQKCPASPDTPGAQPRCGHSPQQPFPREQIERAIAQADASDADEPPARDPVAAVAAGLVAAPVTTTPPPVEHPLPDWRIQRELHVRFGSAKVDGTDIDYKLGAVATGGVVVDNFELLGEYALAGVNYSGAYSPTADHGGQLPTADTDGLMHRFGLAARYDFLRADTWSDEATTGGVVWFEGGVGEEIIDWDKGGVLRRPDLSLGFGLQGAVRTSATRRGGIDLSFHIQFAHRTDLDHAASVCSAPCTQATPPAAWGDRAYLFDLGFVFGG